jgi:electron transfer flavoprotein alpha subunit
MPGNLRRKRLSTNDILILAEHNGDQLKKVALELTTKAKKLAEDRNGNAIALVLGPGAAGAAEKLGSYGADVVLVNEDKNYADYYIGPAAGTLAAVIAERKPGLILCPGTPSGKDIAARAAAKTNAGIITNVLDVAFKNGGFEVAVSIFGGSFNVTKTFVGDGPAIVLARPNAFVPEQLNGAGKVEILNAPIAKEELLVKIIERVVEAGAQAPLEEAAVIVAGGRGIGGPEGFEMLDELAAEFGGVVGASRAAVDSGWISYPHQVGQTGKSVKPQLYVACGISGAIQHKVGMQTSSYIVAINKNPDAPIFQFADCCIVGDLFQIVPELTKEIKKRKQG